MCTALFRVLQSFHILFHPMYVVDETRLSCYIFIEPFLRFTAGTVSSFSRNVRFVVCNFHFS